VRELAKSLVRGLALLAVLPSLVSYRLRAFVFGHAVALTGSSQFFSAIPGLAGQYLRRAFLSRVLAECHPTACVEYGVLFSQPGARIGENAYLGPRCHIGLADIGKDVLLAAGVHVTSGAHIHGTEATDTPIREQPGRLALVTVGEGSWVGSAAVVMADIGRHAIVAAGAVVTKPIPDFAVAGGVPARIIRMREAG
jgi:acetyltransferase-like isoleucine patch superfamily enzyme